MTTYKRNQVEEAIAKVFGAGDSHRDLRMKLKRLLDTDRALGRNSRAKDALNSTFAFFSEDSPGTGFEVWFSGYEAFALMTAWRFLEHGWPQQSAVQVLRQSRNELEREHRDILKTEPGAPDEAKIRKRARPGSLYTDVPYERFLVVSSMSRSPLMSPSSRWVRICHGEKELMEFIKSGGPGQSSTIFGLVRAAWNLKAALEEAAPRKRGRGGL